ncbi:sigma-70 family RNA polymerase sigma factor [Candidatus Uhrbacteria bacterium]|nr:sigma-70 family RNA polymerase sigma factor [Candidatus Uhrbacteria bacterium]
MPTETHLRTLEQDHELFLRLKDDPSVVGEVYDLYADRLYGFLLKRCSHKETAEDLVSHTFMKLLESLPSLEWKNAPLSAWLYQVASNALTDHFRKASTRKDTQLDTDVWDPPSADDPAWTAELKIEGEKLREILKELSDRDQEILDLKFFAQLETAEIAAQLDISPNHASVLVYRALGRLRQKLVANPQV